MFARIAVILALLSLGSAVFGQGVVRDDFEGPQTVLRPAGGDARHKVELHQRVGQNVHSGRWCETLRITGGNGTAVYYSYPITPARVISEWSAGLWVRSDRPGVQVVARVVLPRSKHPETGRPLTALVRGSAYGQVGSWQLLEVGQLPKALNEQVRVLRSQFGPQVDAREAYVDLVLLNVYGGPGTTNVWVDDFEATGLVAPARVAAAAGPRDDAGGAATGSPEKSAPQAPEIDFRTRLKVGGLPFFPRIIEHQGEPLAKLKSLGFNCVLSKQTPTTALLDEAARAGIWLIGPPPAADQLASGQAIDGRFNPVLAWHLGDGLSARQLQPTRRWVKQLRAADPRNRPIVCQADAELDSYTRPPFKVLLARRTTLGTSLELDRFDDWLRERAQLARAAAPLWVTIPSQPHPALVEQMRLTAGMPLAPPAFQEAQIRALVRTALGSRARGLLFASHSRLDANDPATRIRALSLELVNLELQLIERWPAAGNASAGADTSDAHTRGGVIQTDRTRLLLPIHALPGGQLAGGTQPAERVSFTVAGVPEGDNAYELSLARVRPLNSQRVTGGTRVVFGTYNRDSLVVFMQDPHAYKLLKRRLDQSGRRAAEALRELAALRLAAHDAVVARLSQIGRGLPASRDARATAERELQQAAALANADAAKSCERARHALAIVRQIERFYWEQATAAPHLPLTDPLTASFTTLPEHYRLRAEIQSAEQSENRLREGACENLTAMLRAGWKHYSHSENASNGIRTAVELTPQAAHAGGAGLLLRAQPVDEKTKPAAIETPPVWVTSAPVAVEPGDVVRISAWVRLAAPIEGSVDGLAIVDSLGGEPLALRVTEPGDWKQVTMYRAAARRGPMSVTFALAGLGEAAIDDITVQIVRHRRPPPTQARR